MVAVGAGASAAEINSSFKRLSLQHNPDKVLQISKQVATASF